MATFMKYTFILRDIRVLTNSRPATYFIHNLRVQSTFAVRNSHFGTFKGNTHNGDELLISSHYFLKECPQFHTWNRKFKKLEKEEELATANNPVSDPKISGQEEPKKLTLFERFKAMYRDYWYVLVPVHVLTSAVWFGSFYYAAKCGIDIVSFVEKLHLSESIVNKIKASGNSTAGYLAISYALYKIFTPLRYTVTLGGTTISINYLKKWGYIKPIPKKEELKMMISAKRESLREKRLQFKDCLGKLSQKKS